MSILVWPKQKPQSPR